MSFCDDPRSDDTREAPSRGRGGSSDRILVRPMRLDPRDVFTQGLDLPRGPRPRARVRRRTTRYDLRGSEVRTLGDGRRIPGRPVDDLRTMRGRAGDLWHGDLEHLRERRAAPSGGIRRPRDPAPISSR